jgi:hypothetical protein
MPEPIGQPTIGQKDDDGRWARYCTVDDPFTGFGTGAISLTENGRVVTVFDRICTEFSEMLFGEDWLVEAYTSTVTQTTGLVKAANNLNDINIVSILFRLGSVRQVGNIWTGDEIFRSPPIPLARACGPQKYSPRSPGYTNPVQRGKTLSQADPIGQLLVTWYRGIPC